MPGREGSVVVVVASSSSVAFVAFMAVGSGMP